MGLGAGPPVYSAGGVGRTGHECGRHLLRTLLESPRARSLLGLALVLVAMWSLGIFRATHDADGKACVVRLLSQVPQITPSTPDAAIYYNMIARVREGTNYYLASAGVWTMRNEVMDPDLDVSYPFIHRLPTMYVLLGLLPATGLSYVIATLIIGSVAVVGAYWLAERLVIAPAALLSTALVGLYYANMAASVSLFGTEVWAGALGLASMGVLVQATESPEPARARLMWAAAGLAALATLTRELAVAFVLVGLVSTTVTAESRRERLYVPWVGAAALAAAGYVAHVLTAQALIATRSTSAGLLQQWFDPTGAGLVAAVVRASWYLSLPQVLVWLLIPLAATGAYVASRTTTARLALTLTVLGGAFALAMLHAPGWGYDGTVPGYWGDLVMPAIAACAPLSAALLPRWRRRVEATA